MIRTVARMMVVGALVLAGCASVPRSQAKRSELETNANEALQAMLHQDPSIRPMLDRSAGYIVFPSVKQGGFVVGGAGAEGVVYKQGQPIGFATLSQAAVGAIVGGQTYDELVIVRDQADLDKIRAGNFNFGAQASATILRAGAATSTRFGDKGVVAVINPIGGAMLDASITGQQIKFRM